MASSSSFLIFCGFLFLVVQQINAATYYASSTGTGDCSSVANACSLFNAADSRWGTAQSKAGDTVIVAAGTYSVDDSSILLSGITLKTDGGYVLITCNAANNRNRGIPFYAEGNNVKIDGLTFSQCSGTFLAVQGAPGIQVSNCGTVGPFSLSTWGYYPYGMDIQASPNAVITNCNWAYTLIGIQTYQSSGIVITNTSVAGFFGLQSYQASNGITIVDDGTLTNVTVANYSSTAIYTYNGNVVIDNAVVYGSPVGVTHYGHNLTITNSKFSQGGGITTVTPGTSTYIFDSTFTNTTGITSTGIVYVHNVKFVGSPIVMSQATQLTVESSTFSNCVSASISVLQTPGVVRNSKFYGNTGGAASILLGDSSLQPIEFIDCQFDGNQASSGGAFAVGSKNASSSQALHITRALISNSVASSKGGAIFVGNNSQVVITDSIIQGSSGAIGGDAYLVGNISMSNCSFQGGSNTQTSGVVLAGQDSTTAVSIVESMFADGLAVQSTGAPPVINNIAIATGANVNLTNTNLTTSNSASSFCCADSHGDSELYTDVPTLICNYPTLTICGLASCNSTPCSGHGSCYTNGSSGCNCDAKYFGVNCEQYCDASVSCGHGVCSNDGKSCVCNQDYSGAACDQFCNDAQTCHGNGACNSSPVCTCDNGFDITTNCSSCINSLYDPSAKCQSCIAGYYNYPDCVYCDAETTCHGNGVCSAAGTCTCNSNAYLANSNCSSCSSTDYDLATNCTSCTSNHYSYPTCTFCDAATTCHGNGACSTTGTCTCNSNAYLANSNCASCSHSAYDLAKNCTSCTANNYNYPSCTYCDAATCHNQGSCNSAGLCQCSSPNMDAATNCSTCISGYIGYPNCVKNTCTAAETCHGQGICTSDGKCVCSTNIDVATNCATCFPGYIGYPFCYKDPTTGATSTTSTSTTTTTTTTTTGASSTNVGVGASIGLIGQNGNHNVNSSAVSTGLSSTMGLTGTTITISNSGKRDTSFVIVVNGTIVLLPDTSAAIIKQYSNSTFITNLFWKALKTPTMQAAFSGYSIITVNGVSDVNATQAPTSTPTQEPLHENGATLLGYSLVGLLLSLSLIFVFQ